LHHLQHGKVDYQKNYIKKMSILGLDGGLWGDFTTIYWIFEYLDHSIHVWNLKNGQIMVKVEQENESTPLNIIYGNNHF